MSPVTANPSVLEFGLCQEFKWEPQIFDDQEIKLPSFKEVLKWVFLGKPVKILLKKGLEATKIEEFLAILDENRMELEEKTRQIEEDAKAKGGK